LHRQARIYTISGRVQGVWFRDSTRREALKLGISGYAKNLQNGDVEVFADGEASALDRLHQWLHKGPPMAKVSSVREKSVKSGTLTSHEGFTVA
jgi:acylphosphatase